MLSTKNTGAIIQIWQPAELSDGATDPSVGPVGQASDYQVGWELLDFEPAALGPDPVLESPLAQVLQEALRQQGQPFRPRLYPATADSHSAWSPPDLEPLLLEANATALGDAWGAEPGGLTYKLSGEWEERAAQLIRQAEEQASQTLLNAENQASQQIREAGEQAAAITRQAYAEGRAAAKAEMEEMMGTATAIVQEVNAWREDQFNQGELMLLRLVIEIAQSLFGEGLALDPQALGQAFARALAQAKTLGDLRIYVNPDDAAALGPYWQQRQSALSGQTIELVPSDIIKRGGCFVEGQYGSVDSRVESHLQLVKDTLLSTYSASQSQPAAPAGGVDSQ